jgi:prepilin-type N-terminal cleavage/methylation domain-containing protein
MVKKGFSLIEIMVVIGIFAVIAIIATRSTALSLTGAKKSESTVRVRENLEYATSVMERRIRNATKLVSCGSGQSITYEDESKTAHTFTCASIPSSCSVTTGRGYIYLDNVTNRMTSDEINVCGCSFTCTPAVFGVPASVTIRLTGQVDTAVGLEKSQSTVSTQVFTRVY